MPRTQIGKRIHAMRLMLSWLAAVFFVVGVSADEPAGKLVRETWDAAFINGEKAGQIHTTVVESKRGEQTVLRLSRELHLTVKRFGDVAETRVEIGDEETPDGKLLGVFVVMQIARDQQNRISGRVVDGFLQDTSDVPSSPQNQRPEQQRKLPDDLITLIQEE